MSGPIARVLTVLELLQNRQRISGAELAQKLNVDRRTVRRYIAVLEDMGVPVTTEQGCQGGYMLVPGFKLPPMMFTDEETLAIALGLLAARQLGVAAAAPAIETVQAKLHRVMPKKLREKARTVNETTKLLLPRPTPLQDEALMFTVTRAVQQEQQLAFTYQAPNKDPTMREVDPYGLVFQEGRWYLSAYCHLRSDMRSFRLDRIIRASILPTTFQRPKGFNPADHFIDSLNSMSTNYRVLVALYTDAETATNAFYCNDTSALLRPQTDHLLLDTRIDSVTWFARWLAQLPFEFRVLEPLELKEAVRELAEILRNSCGE